MKFVTAQTKIEKIKTDALVVLTSKTLNKSIKHIDKNLNGVIKKMIQDGDFSGKNISTCVVRNESKTKKRYPCYIGSPHIPSAGYLKSNGTMHWRLEG